MSGRSMMQNHAIDRRGTLLRAVAAPLLLWSPAIFAQESGADRDTSHQWGLYEQSLESDRDYRQPLWDVSVAVDFVSPSGAKHGVEAFWNGGREWRFRFSPSETGRWRWTTRSTNAENAGLHQREGEFECIAYQGDNPFYQHGPVGLSADRRYLAHADGTPFFWLADTAWNGALRSTESDWQRYLAARRDQKFSAIQFVTTQWRGATEVLDKPVYLPGEKIALNIDVVRRIDRRLSAINDAGMLAVPVMLWALWESDPGQALAEENAIRLARYMVARWGAHQVAWFLGGDGRFTGSAAPRWRNIGRDVFGDRHDRLVTLHPVGSDWPLPDFVNEKWYDFVGYQSGHSSARDRLQWLVAGPPATDWKSDAPRPFINLEPNYEIHPGAEGGKNFTAYHVRRAAYWSCLVSPTAGVTYGNNPIWVWNSRPAPAEGHERLGEVAAWQEGLRTEGIRDMTHLNNFFGSGHWHRLRPAPDLIVNQPGEQDPARFVAAAATNDGAWIVAYTPVGGRIQFDGSSLARRGNARWFNPRTGEFHQASPADKSKLVFVAPDDLDWALEVRNDQSKQKE